MAGFLEEVGAVKTARRETESILLTRATLSNQKLHVKDPERMFKLAKHNKVILRAAKALNLPEESVQSARKELADAFQLYDVMRQTLDDKGVTFVVIKSFDSLPDMGHDLDFLVSSPEGFAKARSILLQEFKVRPQSLTHCDKLLGKFSCFLPGFVHDFEIYPTISQLGEVHLDPNTVTENRVRRNVEGRDVWLTSDADRVLIRVIHAMYRHNFLKLSDVLDFQTLISRCENMDIIAKVDSSGIGDSFIYLLRTIERFLKASDHDSPELLSLIHDAEARFGGNRLWFLQRDRLVLPYRIPVTAIMILFLLKAGRDSARGRFRSAALCLTTPALIALDFVNAVFNHKLFRRRVW